VKITEVETFLVGNTPPYHGGRFWLFVKLITDEGVEGIGEWNTGNIGREDSQIRVIEDLAQNFVIGEDPLGSNGSGSVSTRLIMTSGIPG